MRENFWQNKNSSQRPREIPFSLKFLLCYFWWNLLGRRKQAASWTEWALELVQATVNQHQHVTHYLVYLNSGAWECVSLASMIRMSFCYLVMVSIWLCGSQQEKTQLLGAMACWCWDWKSVSQGVGGTFRKVPDELGRLLWELSC